MPDSVRDIFALNGPLNALLPQYEPRECQVQMADAVHQAVTRRQHTLIEAGTGTGKTLAYLIPALLSEKPFIVSTATRALQDQLWSNDLPMALRAAGIEAPTALLKGRANYLCLLSMDDQIRQPELEVAPVLPKVLPWANTTATGDLDELGFVGTGALRAALSRGTDACEGRLCAFYSDCWAEKARQRAGEARVVVTNHALVFTDAKMRQHRGANDAALLPDAPLIVLDEAHTVEDVATSAFAAEIDAERPARILNMRRIRDALANRHVRTFTAVLEASTAAFRALDRSVGPGRSPLTEALPAGLRLAQAARELHDAASEVSDPGERGWIERRLFELAMDAQRVFGVEDADWVHYVDRDSQRGLVARAAPIAVDRLIREHLSDRRTVIGTSATLTVGGSFDYLQSRLGLSDARTVATEYAFDYARQAMVYVDVRMPTPNGEEGSTDAYDRAVADAIVQLIEASRGRAFCLFTSYRALNDAWRRLEGRLPYPILRQGDAPAPALLDQFRRSGNAVLLGTRSFWEGVDVRGEALSLVIIPRLPFAVPDDPVVAARTDRLRRQGADWFGGYALPRAVLLLKQGFGRLIRSSTDRGVVAILDSRIVQRSYGRTVLDSLPPARRTSRIDDVRKFFAIEVP